MSLIISQIKNMYISQSARFLDTAWPGFDCLRITVRWNAFV